MMTRLVYNRSGEEKKSSSQENENIRNIEDGCPHSRDADIQEVNDVPIMSQAVEQGY